MQWQAQCDTAGVPLTFKITEKLFPGSADIRVRNERAALTPTLILRALQLDYYLSDPRSSVADSFLKRCSLGSLRTWMSALPGKTVIGFIAGLELALQAEERSSE